MAPVEAGLWHRTAAHEGEKLGEMSVVPVWKREIHSPSHGSLCFSIYSDQKWQDGCGELIKPLVGLFLECICLGLFFKWHIFKKKS